MQQLIVFEGLGETLVGNALAVDQLVSEWFVETRTGAAMVEEELGNELDFQLFYNENLETKLLRSLQK